jgi:hypothetical protein
MTSTLEPPFPPRHIRWLRAIEQSVTREARCGNPSEALQKLSSLRRHPRIWRAYLESGAIVHNIIELRISVRPHSDQRVEELAAWVRDKLHPYFRKALDSDLHLEPDRPWTSEERQRSDQAFEDLCSLFGIDPAELQRETDTDDAVEHSVPGLEGDSSGPGPTQCLSP